MIQYERVVYEETNTLSSLNLTRGVFTADTPGVWKVDWSLVTEPEDGQENNIFLHRDGEKIGEYNHYAVHVGGRLVHSTPLLLRPDLLCHKDTRSPLRGAFLGPLVVSLWHKRAGVINLRATDLVWTSLVIEGGWSAVTGGRSVFLHLAAGAELSLAVERVDGGVFGLVLCVSLQHQQT